MQPQLVLALATNIHRSARALLAAAALAAQLTALATAATATSVHCLGILSRKAANRLERKFSLRAAAPLNSRNSFGCLSRVHSMATCSSQRLTRTTSSSSLATAVARASRSQLNIS